MSVNPRLNLSNTYNKDNELTMSGALDIARTKEYIRSKTVIIPTKSDVLTTESKGLVTMTTLVHRGLSFP